VNEDLVRRGLERWNAGELSEHFLEFCQPDAVLDITANALNPGMFEGQEGLRTMEADVAEAWAEFRMEPQEVIERGDVVVVLVAVAAVGRESGVEMNDSTALVFRLRDGLISSIRVEPDRAAALALVGR